jgi:RNA polymerase sigma-70 factor (ECF subfamily)
MFNTCLRILNNATEAEDVLQESFIEAFKNLHSFEYRTSFGGWLKRIVISECIRFNKKGVRWAEMDDKYEQVHDEDGAGWMHGISFEQINTEIRMLPGGCREVFNLFVLENYSHKEIAEALGVSESTSKSQYHRARQLLKERLLKQMVLHG